MTKRNATTQATKKLFAEGPMICPFCGKPSSFSPLGDDSNIHLIWAHEEFVLGGGNGSLITASCQVIIAPGKSVLVAESGMGHLTQCYYEPSDWWVAKEESERGIGKAYWVIGDGERFLDERGIGNKRENGTPKPVFGASLKWATKYVSPDEAAKVLATKPEELEVSIYRVTVSEENEDGVCKTTTTLQQEGTRKIEEPEDGTSLS